MNNDNKRVVKIEEINFEDIKELEEVVTPGWGTALCCTE
jgi:hypothetical protein